ncbi:MAG TPA: hypothetical protein VNW97_21885 [Candidatus Saccharimonadales bacterium]|jgi:hypothetical protein|nr:hypothetical protein [Candidatus Saccharimonadales bacterium]
MKKGSPKGYYVETGDDAPTRKPHTGEPHDCIHYIGFDVHKKSVSFCVKTAEGEIVEEGKILAQRSALRQWAMQRKQAWRGAMEATLFSAWIYDTLKPYAEQLQIAHPARMKAMVFYGHTKDDPWLLTA